MFKNIFFGKFKIAAAVVLAAGVLACYFIPQFINGSSSDIGNNVITNSPSEDILPVSIKNSSVSASSAILIEAESGKIIWEKDAYKKRAVASTTKILTALIALSQTEIDRPFIVDSNAIRVEGSSMGLVDGDTVTLRDLAVGMLTVSGNDAANAAAVKISGSTEKFAELMNNTVRSFGLKDTNFETPSGLDSADHYSTAYDMAVIASIALENKDFLEICSSRTVKANYGNPPYLRSLMNKNRLLRSYEGAIGVKTGFTKKAGRCLVSAAERDGIRIICVTLNAADDWNDHATLLDLGFNSLVRPDAFTENMNYTIPVFDSKKIITIIPSRSAQVTCLKGETDKINAIVNLPMFTYLPVKAGQVLGNIEYEYNGKIVETVDLIASADIVDEEK